MPERVMLSARYAAKTARLGGRDDSLASSKTLANIARAVAVGRGASGSGGEHHDGRARATDDGTGASGERGVVPEGSVETGKEEKVVINK